MARCCEGDKTPGERLQEFLDAPLIDPLKDSMGEPEALRWYAKTERRTTLTISPDIPLRSTFSPIHRSKSDPCPHCRFKALIRQDYYLAEAIWAGLYLSVVIIFAQQLVRVYKASLLAGDHVRW